MNASSAVASPRIASQARRRPIRITLQSVLLSAVAAAGGIGLVPASNAQALFVGDAGDNSVKQFDVSNGSYAGPFVPSNAQGLAGPTGMIFTNGQFLVANQNVNAADKGEVLRFDGTTGTYIGKLVSSTDFNAPFAPRGIVRGGPDNLYYVADMVGDSCANGNVKRYDDAGSFSGNLELQSFPDVFHPRGVVFGPDGDMYVSSS